MMDKVDRCVLFNLPYLKDSFCREHRVINKPPKIS
jgi:hypothetical protein